MATMWLSRHDRKFIKEQLEWCLQNSIDDEEFMHLNSEEKIQFAQDIARLEHLIKRFGGEVNKWAYAARHNSSVTRHGRDGSGSSNA